MASHDDDYRPSGLGPGSSIRTPVQPLPADPTELLPSQATEAAARAGQHAGTVSGTQLPANGRQAPLQALPIDTTPGSWIDAVEGDDDAAARWEGYDAHDPLHTTPVPLIGAVTLAGDVVLALTQAVPANGWLDVGELNSSRPSVIQIVLVAAAVGLEIQGLSTGTSTAAGFPIPSTRELTLHSRAAHVRNTTGAPVNLSWLLITRPDN